MSESLQNEIDPVAPAAPEQNTTQNTEQSVEWSYSGKAMRAQAILYALTSVLFIGFGIYATVANLPYMLIWYCIIGLLVILWGYYYTVYLYRTLTIRYRLTDQRLYAYRGLFTRTSDSMELVYIDDMRLVQTLFDRILNGGVGSLHILCTSDKTDSDLILKGIDKPQEIFEKIDMARATLRAKRSILTGA